MSLLNDFDTRYKRYAEAIESALDAALPRDGMPQKRLLEAMRYGLLDGGKRLRPVMLLDFCRMCGGDWRGAIPFACALEMVHCYSLIHDDLPCMDNDGFRRGKPSCHVKYGEATALLAGSALLSAAFELAAPNPEVCLIIARASGLRGIAGGQELDLHRDGAVALEEIHLRKTAAMFVAAAEAGCVIAGADARRMEAAARFGRSFGLGFQFADDFADGETEGRGKALEYYREALAYLGDFEHTDFMEALVRRMMAKSGGE